MMGQLIETSGILTSVLERMVGVIDFLHNYLLLKYSKIIGNQESQYYTDRVENVRCEGQRLIIEARREEYGGQRFTSARLKSKNAWTYGRLQVCLNTITCILIIYLRQKQNYQMVEVYGRLFGW